jgi:hypothetical protein
MSLPIIAGLAKTGLGIIDQLVVDKDKKAEMAFEWNKALLAFAERLVTMSTIPWVDATVKLLIALVALARPVGSLYLTLIGVDMVQAGDDSVVGTALTAAFPTWMGAREVDKKRKAAIEHRKLDKQKDDPFWFEE